MLAKTYKQQLEKMLAREDLKGKGLLKQFIWMNEKKPKYKVGDSVQFTARGLSVYGNSVVNFVGRIKSINLWPRERIIHYEIEFTTVAGDQRMTHTAYCNEDSSEIKGKVRFKENKIIRRDDHSDAIHI